MPKNVTVNLEDLRFLVKLAWALSVESRAQKALRIHQISKNRKVVEKYVAAYRLAVPDARKQAREIYGDLLKSLKSGENVPQTLSSFVVRAAKSPDVADKKPRPLP
jgi:hypothetical protein